jgi:3-hydroxy-9,10-secoandrosta-1,3,5(10)-triene-9,17-dione monooxygenase reductase component
MATYAAHGALRVSVLDREHDAFARRATPAGAERFAEIDWEFGPGGAPLLSDALATPECEIVAEHPAGDHWIVVGQVDRLQTSPVGQPLIFFAGAFGVISTVSDGLRPTVQSRTRHDHALAK